MTAQAIASKFRRAIRNGTGANFTHDQLRELAENGVLELIAKLEAEELCPAKNPHTPLANIGWQSGETASPLIGRSRTTGAALDKSSIAALTRAC